MKHHCLKRDPIIWDRSLRHLLLSAAVVGILSISTGCPVRKNQQNSASSQASTTQRFRSAIKNKDWENAWKLSGDALIETPNDADLLDLASQAAFYTGRADIASDLLVDAYHADVTGGLKRLRRTLAGLTSTGHVFRALDVMRDAVKRDPQDAEARRLLLDTLLGLEEHQEAQEHSRHLVRQRAFDLNLLFGFDSHTFRVIEDEIYQQMAERHPNDLRPMVGPAKRTLDRNGFVKAEKQLREILNQHADFSPAYQLLGRVLVYTGQFAELRDWADRYRPGFDESSDFWLTLGDWATHHEDSKTALHAYAKAAQIGTDRTNAWAKLVGAIESADVGEDATKIRVREADLRRLTQHFAEGQMRDQYSSALALNLSQTLVDLGRLWEAEAWLAVGFTQPNLSDSDRKAIESARNDVLGKLRKQTPWQQPEKLPTWDWTEKLSARQVFASLSGNPNTVSSDQPAKSDAWNRLKKWVSNAKTPDLVNEATQRGVRFFGRTTDDPKRPNETIHQVNGCGGGSIDFDRDGWCDLYLADAGGTPPDSDSRPNLLMRNLAGQFVAVPQSGGAADRGFGQGIAIGDVNEDGFDDIVVLNYGPNGLYINQGDGTFTNHSDSLPEESVWSTCAAIADIDDDGITDIVSVNYCTGLEPANERCEKGSRPRICAPNHFFAAADTFLKGTPTGRFNDVTRQWGGVPVIPGRGLGIIAGALDHQLGVDLYVANDTTVNHFWTRGDQSASTDPFQLDELAVLKGIAVDAKSKPQGSMGIAAADMNHDGQVDFFVTHFMSQYNTLYASSASQNDQSPVRWSDTTVRSGLADSVLPMVGFGTQSVDFDNNGERELIIANGHVDQLPSEAGFHQPVQMFQSDTNGQFHLIPPPADRPYLSGKHVGRALWTIDANRDLKVDLVVTHLTEPTALLINQTDSNYSAIAFELVAKEGSRNAVGSVVSVTQSDVTFSHPVTSGDGYYCSNERGVWFGLGNRDLPVDVSVRWPNGQEQVWTGLRPNERWLLIQGDEAFSL